LPIGPGKTYFNNRGITGQIVGGWQIGWILDEEVGTPFGVYQNLSFPYPNGGGNRPNRNPSVGISTAGYARAASYFTGKIKVAQMFPADTFTQAAPYTLGDSYRNYYGLRQPGYFNEDVNVRKHFTFTSRFQGVLQVDYFNVLNRTQFNGPDNNISDGTFGQENSQGQNNSTRQGQAQFRLEF
jgi:hypothetical protein